MTQIWPKLQRLFQTISLLCSAPNSGRAPARLQRWRGLGRGPRSGPLCASISPSQRPRGSVQVLDQPRGTIPQSRAMESRSRGLLGPPAGQSRDSAPGHGTGGGGAGQQRLPGSRGALGVSLGCPGALCALAQGPRPLAGAAAAAPLPAPPPAAPLKRPRGSAPAPPRTPRSSTDHAAPRAPRRPRPVR